MSSMPLHLVEENPDPALEQFLGLRDWVHAQARSQAEIHTAEEGIGIRGRELCRLFLAEFVEFCGIGDVGAAIEVQRVVPISVSGSGTGGQVVAGGVLRDAPVVLNHRRERSCGYLSEFGEIDINRLAYSQRGEASLIPLDELLALPERKYSYRIQEKLTTAIARGPFDVATRSVEEATGQQVSTANAYEVVQDVAADFDPFYESQMVPAAEETPSILVAVADGKGIHMRALVEEASQNGVPTSEPRRGTTQQATVAAVYNIEPFVRTSEDIVKESNPAPLKLVQPRPRPENKRVWASLKRTKTEIFTSIASEMIRRDPEHEKIWVCVTDGDRALRRVARTILGAVGPFILILDLYHALEYLWEAAHALHGKDSSDAKEWCTMQLRRLIAGEVSAVARGMRQSATKRGLTGANREPVDRAAGYFLSNKDSMKYHEYIAAGLPIGSGVGEGSVKNLIGDRLEGTGMHWTADVAEAVLQMRALELSGDTKAYWPFHIKQEQQRLYGNTAWTALDAR